MLRVATRKRRWQNCTEGKQRGFTILEMAIVLVVIGILVGGVLLGQELILTARARSLINQQEELRVAFFNFQDRYQFPPGDYSEAIAHIGATRNGDGDGRIEGTREGGTENILVWEHLSRAGFIGGRFTYSAAPPFDNAIPRSPFGPFLDIAFDNWHGDPAATNRKIHNIKTGNGIPAAILGEVDLKIDDSKALAGSFQFSDFRIDGVPLIALGAGPACVNDDAALFGTWNVATTPSATNCGGATLL
jgi:prepilin-type N-terminal cleavage/methylation domain-containing protein